MDLGVLPGEQCRKSLVVGISYATVVLTHHSIMSQAIAEAASNKPATAIAETGWPTGKQFAKPAHHFRATQLKGSLRDQQVRTGPIHLPMVEVLPRALTICRRSWTHSFVKQMPTGLTTFSVSDLCRATGARDHSSDVNSTVEAFDEPWKEVSKIGSTTLLTKLPKLTSPFAFQIYGGVEPHWGVFDEHRNLKAVTLPDCSHT